VCGYVEATDCSVLTAAFVNFADGDLAIAFERHDEVLAEVTLDVLHIVGGRKPHVVEHVLERHLIMHRDAQQHAVALVFGHGTAPFGVARLRINILLGLRDEIEGDGQRDVADMVEGRQEFDPFDVAVEAVAPMPTDDVVLIGERLATDAVINTQGGFGALDVAYQRFDVAPQVGAVLRRFGEQAGHLIVADLTVQQAGQTRRGGRAKGADQVVGVEVEELLVVHLSSLPERPLTA